MFKIALVAVDVRSTHNVGAFFRTCDGLGISNLYLSGITPRPAGQDGDNRLPHAAERATRSIHKTALGAENSIVWEYFEDTMELIAKLKKDGWRLCALEQNPRSQTLIDYIPRGNTALIVGAEVEGLVKEVIELCDDVVEIPMLGLKESFNVSVAAGMGLFYLINL